MEAIELKHQRQRHGQGAESQYRQIADRLPGRTSANQYYSSGYDETRDMQKATGNGDRDQALSTPESGLKRASLMLPCRDYLADARTIN